MADVEVVVNDKAFRAKMDRVTSQAPAEMQRLMTKSVLYAQSQIPSYPSPPPGSSYRRTGTLGRTVTAFPGVSPARSIGGSGGENPGAMPLTRVEPFSGGVRGVIGGRLDYMPYVIDEGNQAYMHKGRWWTLQKIVRDSRDGIIKIFREGVLGWFK